MAATAIRRAASVLAEWVDYQQYRVRNAADELITDKGEIMIEFFDQGQSRRAKWSDRSQAGALLTAVADPNRGFDAVVIGEYERAFFGDQLTGLLPVFARHGVQLWLPETNGHVEGNDTAHQALVMLLGVSIHSRS